MSLLKATNFLAMILLASLSMLWLFGYIAPADDHDLAIVWLVFAETASRLHKTRPRSSV